MASSQNCVILGPNFLDATYYTVTFTGGIGSWNGALPLANLKDPFLSVVARSTDATLASTKFEVDLGSTRNIRGVAFPYANVTQLAQIRVRLSNVSNDYSSPIADTGWQNWYPTIYPFGTLLWSDASFWFGTMQPEDALTAKMPWWWFWDTPQVARYVLIELSDTSNTAGYIDLPRLVIAPGYQPTLNMDYGAQIGLESMKVPTNTLGGAEVFQDGLDRRVARLSFRNLPQDEALAGLFDIGRKQSINSQVFFAFDPTNTFHRHRWAFLGRLRALPQSEWAVYGRVSQSIEISEVVA
jgi:hypothetical protein